MNEQKKHPGGRPSKYETEIVPRFDEIEHWIRTGFSERDVAKKLGISWTTYKDYKNKYPEFSARIQKARHDPVDDIKAALLNRACGFKYTEKKTVIEYEEFSDDLREALLKLGLDVDVLGKRQMVRTEIYEKQALPDPASCMILLKQWAKDEGWTNDPQSLELRRQELELRKQKLEEDNW